MVYVSLWPFATDAAVQQAVGCWSYFKHQA